MDVLSLIKKCGENFHKLRRYRADLWGATMDFGGHGAEMEILGRTPEEALKKLLDKIDEQKRSQRKSGGRSKKTRRGTGKK